MSRPYFILTSSSGPLSRSGAHRVLPLSVLLHSVHVSQRPRFRCGLPHVPSTGVDLLSFEQLLAFLVQVPLSFSYLCYVGCAFYYSLKLESDTSGAPGRQWSRATLLAFEDLLSSSQSPLIVTIYVFRSRSFCQKHFEATSGSLADSLTCS